MFMPTIVIVIGAFVFGAIFTYQDAKSLKVANSLLFAFGAFSFLSWISWFLDAPSWSLFSSMVVGICFIALGEFFDSKGLMGSGDWYYFAFLSWLFPASIISAFNVPFIAWVLLLTGMFATFGFFGDLLFKVKADSPKPYPLGPFIFAGFIAALYLLGSSVWMLRP